MRLSLLIILSLLLLSRQAEASHEYRGGKLEYHFRSADSIEIVLTLYSGCADIGLFNRTQKLITDYGADTLVDSLPLCNYYYTPNICPDTLSRCLGGPLIYSSMVWQYRNVFHIAHFIGCNLKFYWNGKAFDGTTYWRTPIITTGHAATTICLYSSADFCAVKRHNSPLFTQQFPDAIPVGRDINYSYGITTDDPDNDSIYFELITPMENMGVPVSYSGVWAATRPCTFLGFPNNSLSPPAGFHVDNVCPRVYFRPTLQNQVTQVTTKVSRFVKRGGNTIKVSEVVYEHLIIVGNVIDWRYYFPGPIIWTPGACVEKSEYVEMVCGTNKPQADPPRIKCTDDSIRLSTTFDSSYSYQWKKNDTILPGATAYVYWALDSGRYTVDVVNKITGCIKTSAETRMVIFDGEMPVITFDSTHRYCKGDTVFIERENKKYTLPLWKQDGQPYSDDTALFFPVTKPGVYTFNAINKQGCKVSSNALKITLYNPDTSRLFSQRVRKHCGNFTDTLKPDRKLKIYTWQLSLPDSSGQVVVTNPGVYKLSGKDTNNCPVLDSVTVLKFSNPVVNIGNDTIVCFNAHINFRLNAGSGFSKYTWNGNLSDSLPVYMVTDSGHYSVTATDSNGCNGADSLDVSRYLPVILNLGKDTLLCNTASYTISAPPGFSEYQWSTGATADSISVSTGANYFLKVTDSVGCTVADTVNVSFDKTPEIALEDTVLCEQDFILLQVKNEYDNYLWSNGSKTYYSEIKDTGAVWVRAWNACGDSLAEAWVRGCRYEPPVIVIPNAFTPNADGFNNVFKIYAENIRRFDMKIFNRWGQLIFESKDLETGWDGNYYGVAAPQEIYMYIISIMGKNYKLYTYYGNITLIR